MAPESEPALVVACSLERALLRIESGPRREEPELVAFGSPQWASKS